VLLEYVSGSASIGLYIFYPLLASLLVILLIM
jgi:hypothetical protein